MKYTVEINDEGQTIKSRHDCSKKEAVSLAKSWAKQIEDDGLVFISWFRKSDSQLGYLNPDGNHDITGKAW